MLKRGMSFEAIEWSASPADLADAPLQPDNSNDAPKEPMAAAADPVARLRSRIAAALRKGTTV
ncbi:MAG: hypothetical protein ACLQDM_27875 [Bradyrhizobium sp.]